MYKNIKVSVTLTLTLKFLFKAYCHNILTNAILHIIFLKEEALHNWNKEIV